MNVGRICNRHVVQTTPTERILAAARRMRDEHVGDLVVVDEVRGKLIPVGMLTDRDIVVGIVARDVEHLATLDVGDVLNREVLTAEESEDVRAVLDRMAQNGVRRMPVVDDGGTLVGIFSLDDWLGTVSQDFHCALRILDRERREEQKRRP
jgi:CBS domain-containing protein